MTDLTVGREEFRMLTGRVDAIDTGGTRGMGVLAVQVQELAKDFARHEEKHEQERRERAANRKWLFTAAFLAIGAIDGPIVAILLHQGH